MESKKIKIGELVEVYSKTCGISNLLKKDVSGINREKEFFEPAKQVGKDTSKYKVVPPNHFACNLMHVGRDAVLPIALNYTNKDKIVSPAYVVFKLRNEEYILKEYFFILLNSGEKDRFFWFNTDSSVREGLPWEVFCDIELTLPPINIQKKYVDIYKTMVKNQESYENGLEDLKLICDIYINNLKKTTESEKIGKYIIRQDNRNSENKFSNVKSVSVLKEFNAPSSKVNKKALKSYKIVNPHEIAFVQTTHNEKVLCCAINNSNEEILVTSVNEVFSCKKELLPNYLMLFLCTKEFDRYARFHSWGSVRETFCWDDMQNVKIPIPDIKIQKSIAEIYKVYMQRKEINKKLKEQIKNICPILICGSLQEKRGE